MHSWQNRTLKYFLAIILAVVLSVSLFIFADVYKSRQVKASLTAYMDNLRDLVFMSTYDSLKKGNMHLFKSHLVEIGTFDYVREFSLLNVKGETRYSSDPQLVRQYDAKVVDLDRQLITTESGFTTYYFPVETTSYCSRCHADWQEGSINSYYKLVLSRTALDALREGTLRFHGFSVAGAVLFMAFIYLLFTLYERRKIEEQMQLSASVFESAVEAIVITSFNGMIQRVNASFVQMTGFTPEEVYGRDIHCIEGGDINAETYREMRASIRTIGTWTGELWNRRKSGELFPVRLSVTAVRNRLKISHFVSVFYDISARKAAEKALVDMNRLKSEFISTAAHELRTPLSVIMGYAELLRKPETFGEFSRERTHGFLDEMYERGEALNQLIDDLLDIGRIESGQALSLNRQESCLVEVIERVIDFYRVNDAQHTYETNLPHKGPDTLCEVDRYRINQVLENLLNNARKYSSAGTHVAISCRLEKDAWLISVCDQGIGMTPEQVERVFEKFYRADASDSAVSGFGLGMSIARQIVELHGGRIWVESSKGVGTTVTFTLPRCQGRASS